MVSHDRPLSRKNQNSFSLYPAASFEGDVVADAHLVGQKLGDADSAESHGKDLPFFLSNT